MQTVSTESGVKKVSVPLNAISRVIGRGGSNINAIRGATGAHIEVEKQSKGQGERIITIKYVICICNKRAFFNNKFLCRGSAEATKQAHSLIAILIRDPDVDILQMLPKANKTTTCALTLWDKTQIGVSFILCCCHFFYLLFIVDEESGGKSSECYYFNFNYKYFTAEDHHNHRAYYCYVQIYSNNCKTASTNNGF